MTRRITITLAAAVLSGCGLFGPPPTGHIEGRVIVCVVGDSVCIEAARNVQITLTNDEGATMESMTLTSETFRFNDVEVGTYTLDADFVGASSCLFVFEAKPVIVTEDETAKVVIEGRGRC